MPEVAADPSTNVYNTAIIAGLPSRILDADIPSCLRVLLPDCNNIPPNQQCGRYAAFPQPVGNNIPLPYPFASDPSRSPCLRAKQYAGHHQDDIRRVREAQALPKPLAIPFLHRICHKHHYRPYCNIEIAPRDPAIRFLEIEAVKVSGCIAAARPKRCVTHKDVSCAVLLNMLIVADHR